MKPVHAFGECYSDFCVDIQPKTRYNMPDNKQGWNITLEYLMFCAGVAQWQSNSLPC